MVSEALQQSFMATKLSCTSSLPWIWVIEALASSNEIDTSLLINLVKRAPELSDDLGRNAREMVSLRILESLFVRKNSDTNNAASVPGDKIELDPSRGCEDVLRHILLEVPAPELKTAAPEMLKWDVQSFIMEKRSRLPKCLLQQLKDTIVDSTNPLSTSLKQRSGLEFGNHSRDAVTVDAVDSDGFKQGHEVGDVNTRHVAPTGNLDTFSLGNTNDVQENQPGSNLVPAKRSINASTAYETEVSETKAISENSSDSCAKAAKKFKQDVVSPIQNTVPDLILSQRAGLPAEPCGGSQSTVRERNSENEAQVGTLEANGCRAEHAASRSVLCGGDSNINGLLPERTSTDKEFQDIGSSSNGYAELETSSGSSLLVIQQDSRTRGSKSGLDCNLPQDLQNGEPSEGDRENIERSHESEFGSDTDEYHNLASQKNDFLNSQYAQGEDSLATVDCTELSLCVKCNEGGNLLICSSDTCPLVVHESCLSSVPNFDYNGNFYCPFCAYSRAISEYRKGKKEVSLARKDLAAFIGVGAGQRSKKSLPKSQGMKQHQSRADKNEQLCPNVNGGNSLNDVTEARSAPADRISVGAQVMQIGSPQPEASLPEQCLVAGQQPKKSPLRCHRSRQNQSREEEGLYHKKDRKKNSLEKAEEAGTVPVNRNSTEQCVVADQQPDKSPLRCLRSRQNQSREEEGLCHKKNRKKNSVEKAEEAGSGPVNGNSTELCIVVYRQPDKSPFRFHRSRQNQSRQVEELRHEENRSKNSLEKAEEAGSFPVNRNSMNAEVMQMQPPQPQESSSIEESSEEEEEEEEEQEEEEEEEQEEEEEDDDDDEDEDEIGSQYRVQFRNREYTSPLNPRQRRKILPWTKREEETLQEGLLRFSHFRDRWKRILEFGRDVFQQGRTTNDIRDKWRNITKAAEKAK